MSEVKRWNVESDAQDGPCSLWNVESAEGEFVTYEDYVTLKSERDALAAENAALQKLAEMGSNHSAVVLGPPTYWHQDGGKLQYTIETSEPLKNGTELFTRPAPPVSLAELVPPEADGSNLPFAANGWNACRSAILRKIEEAK